MSLLCRVSNYKLCLPCQHLLNINKYWYNLKIIINQMCSRNEFNNKPEKIYCGLLTPRIRAVKIFSLTTSIAGIAAQPIIIEQSAKLGGTPMMIFMSGFVGFFTFITPALLHYITKRYVSEIYYNQSNDNYTVNTISFFLTKKEMKFKLSDVEVPEVSGMFSTFSVNKTPLFVDPSMFKDTDHYIKLMGFDKPINLKLNINDCKMLKEQIEKNK